MGAGVPQSGGAAGQAKGGEGLPVRLQHIVVAAGPVISTYMYVYTCVYKHTCVCACICVYEHTYMYVYICVYIYIYIYAYVQIDRYVYPSGCLVPP